MLNDLFIHGCVVISLYFLGGAIFRNYHFTSSRKSRLFLGVFSGVVGSILIHFSIRITDYVILDLRHVSIIISALYGGRLSAVVTTSIISATRFFLFPLSYSTFASLSTMFFITFTVIIISRLTISQIKKAILMIVCSTFLFSIMFCIILHHYDLKAFFIDYILSYYVPASLVGGLVTFYLVNYIVTSNHSYLELKKQAQYDYLTGLKNVRQFHLMIESIYKQANETNQHFALLFIDIDHFKFINDTYGHPAGDEVLKSLARVLIHSTEIEDAVFRNGGEEFSILLSDTNKETALNLGELIREKVAQHKFHLPNSIDINITISIGIALNDSGENIADIIFKADKALYCAKNSGRNKVKVV